MKQYESPEVMKIQYAQLSVDDLSGEVEATDEDIELFYENNRDLYKTPEQRSASHILLTLDSDADDEAWAAYQQACAAVARDALERGEVVLTPGGWAARQEHGFVPWCYAGIVTQVKDDGTVLGACLNGRQDNVSHHLVPGGTFGLSAAEPTLAVLARVPVAPGSMSQGTV